MAIATREYLKSLIPDGLVKGEALLEEGRKLGSAIQAGKSRLVRDSNYHHYLEYFQAQAARGEIGWTTNVGLATVEEHVRGVQEIHDWCEKLKIKYNFTISIPSTLLAIPKEKRRYDLRNTSYVPESLEDYKRLGDIRGMEVIQGDQVLFVPNAWETGLNALKAGSSQIGCVSQLMWSHPGCEDHVQYLMDTLRILGVISQKWDEGIFVGGYLDDTYPSYCKDAIAYVAYALFEQYVITHLCHVRYATAFGGLISDIRTKAALLKALYDVLYTDEQPPILFTHANTTRYWDHDIEANYGMLAQEILMAVLAERRYKTGAMIVPVPITEKVCVPTVDSIKNVLGVSGRLLENIEQWEDVIDFTRIDQMAEVIKNEGTKMFNNMLTVLDDAGIDIKDPLHMLLFIKKFDAGLLEETFHPRVKENGRVDVYFYTDMGQLTQKMIDESEKEIGEKELSGVLRKKKVLVASTDAHVYGVHYVRDVLKEAGADVLDGGVDSSIKEILDIAEEEEIHYIGISTHNGQALGLAEQVLEELNERSGTYTVFLGGVLNTILPGHSEPSDVKNMINEKGVFASNDIIEIIQMLAEN